MIYEDGLAWIPLEPTIDSGEHGTYKLVLHPAMNVDLAETHYMETKGDVLSGTVSEVTDTARSPSTVLNPYAKKQLSQLIHNILEDAVVIRNRRCEISEIVFADEKPNRQYLKLNKGTRKFPLVRSRRK